MRARQPRRHLCFQRLLEVLRQPGCPMCRVASEASGNWLRAFFHEQVTDALARERLRRGGAFCARHTEQAVRMGDPLGSSIIYGDLLQRAADGLYAGWTRQCLLCDHEEQALHAIRNTLLEHIAEEDVLAAYSASDGLCVPHLQMVVGRGRGAGAQAIIEVERAKLDVIISGCEGFVAKSHYENCTGLTENERTAWLRAARKLGGEWYQ